jgi:hypothetical protein
MMFTHIGRKWSVIQIGGSFFARDDQGCDTGPYSTAKPAAEWAGAIRP